MRAALIAVCLFALTSVYAQDTKPADTAAPAANPKVLINTSKGDIVVELDAARAPKSVENFLAYAKSGFYAGTIFHRVISNFMVQGGGYNSGLIKKPTNPPIPLEVGKGLSNSRGTLAMARTNDPNSASSQFFINVVDNTQLDTLGGGYAVFGRVVTGMEVVDAIRDVPTEARSAEFANLPTEAVVIQKVEIIE